MIKYQEVSRDVNMLIDTLHDTVPEDFIMLDETAVEVVYNDKTIEIGCGVANCTLKLTKKELILNTLDDVLWARIDWKILNHIKTTDKEYIFDLGNKRTLTIIS